jgi:hypothetical protein
MIGAAVRDEPQQPPHAALYLRESPLAVAEIACREGHTARATDNVCVELFYGQPLVASSARCAG